MLLEAIGPAGRCSGGVVMIYWFRAPALTSSITLTRAREGQAVVPLLRGRSPTRSVAPKPLRGLGRASLRLPWARGCRRIWRGVILVYWFRRRDAARGDRAGWAVQRRRSYDLLVLAPRVNLLCHPYARARGPGRGPAATGSLANEIGRAKTAEGSRACFSPAFPRRVGAEEIWRGVILVYWFWRRDAARGDRAGWAVQRRRSYDLLVLAPALTSSITLTRAREGQAVVPLLRGRSPTRSVAPKPLRGLGRASLRLPSARGCRRIWRGVILVYWFRRRDAARGDRAGWAVQRRRSYDLLVLGPRVNLLCHPYARARGPGRGLPLLRGRSPTRSVAPKPLRGLGRASLRLPSARGCRRNLARRNFGLLVLAARCCSRRSGRLGGAAAA